MNYIDRLTLEYNKMTQEYIVMVKFVSGKMQVEYFVQLKDAQAFVNKMISDELALDDIPF